MTVEEFRDIVFSFYGVIEKPHFDKVAFKTMKSRIFATLHAQSNSANLKLPLTDQNTFCLYNKNIIYPVTNKWGFQGWTTFELNEVPVTLMLDALETAYKNSFKSKKST